MAVSAFLHQKKKTPAPCQAQPKYWQSALLKGTESRERGGRFFFHSQRISAYAVSIYTLRALLRINSVQHFPFSTEKRLIHALYHVSTNNEHFYGAMHRYNETPPEHIALGPCKGTVVANDAFQFVN